MTYSRLKIEGKFSQQAKCINIPLKRCPGMFGDQKASLWDCFLSTKCQSGTISSRTQPKNGPVTIIAPCPKIKWGPYFRFLGPQINFPGILGVLALRENYSLITFCNAVLPILFLDKVSTQIQSAGQSILNRKKIFLYESLQNIFFRSLLIIPGQNQPEKTYFKI